ncbi:MAG: RNA polymerase sigma factor [Bacteroidales bacterium]|nr:RNA polymerase sigma factor [Bacteroidales bacterium]
MTVAEYNHSVDEYADRLFRFVVKSMRDEEAARDVVQETFAKLWTKIADVSGEKVRSYLFTAAYHTMIDVIRKEKRKVDFEEVNAEDYSHDDQYTDLPEIVNAAIDKLPELQRRIIILRDYEGYSYREIGEITGHSESQIKVYIYRARMFLKKHIGSIQTVI